MSSDSSTSAPGEMPAATARFDPIVIVSSLGSVSAEQIIDNIRGVPIGNDRTELPLFDGSGERLVAHRFRLTNKYYSADIQFVPYDRALAALPARIQDSVEGIMCYFDAGNREILKQIDEHLKYAKDHGLQLLMLLCDRLFDDAREGMTYKEIKHCTQVCIDVIELARTADDSRPNASGTLRTSADSDADDTDDDDGHHDPVGYAELLQVLQNNIWSNVNVAEIIGGALATDSNASDSGDDTAASTADVAAQEQLYDSLAALSGLIGDEATKSTASGTAAPAAVDDEQPMSEEQLEAEVKSFEKLMYDILKFRNDSADMSLADRLAYTQNMASAFDDLVEQDRDDDSADGGGIL